MMKVGDIAIVKEVDRNNVHPAGTRVKILIVTNPKLSERNLYCQTTEGKTCYNYGESELEKVNE